MVEQHYETRFDKISNPVPYAPVLRFDPVAQTEAKDEIHYYKGILITEKEKPDEQKDRVNIDKAISNIAGVVVENGLFYLYEKVPVLFDLRIMKYQIMPKYAFSKDEIERTRRMVSIRQKYFTNFIYPYGVRAILADVYENHSFFQAVNFPHTFFTPINEEETFVWSGFLESLNRFYKKSSPLEKIEIKRILKWKLGDFPLDISRY